MESVSFSSAYLIASDKILSYVPFIGSIVSAVDIFEKLAVLPFISEEKISENHYLSYIDQKSYTRSIVLLFPFIGIGVAFYDFIKAIVEDFDKKMTETYAEMDTPENPPVIVVNNWQFACSRKKTEEDSMPGS